MKQKIVFYGNFQLAVLGRALTNQNAQFNESYEVLKASDYDLMSVWPKWPNFVASPFMYLPDKKNEGFTKKVIHSIEKIIDDADIIVCQDFRKGIRERPVKATTEYIHHKYNNKKQVICLPVFNFSGYLNQFYQDRETIMPYVFIWLIEQGYNNSEILNWLKNEYNPKFANLIEYAANKSINKNRKKQKKESAKFKNYIETFDILNDYKDHLIVTSTNHPTSYYYQKLHKRFIKMLNPDLSLELDIDKNVFPSASSRIPNLFEFRFFREVFPNLNIENSSSKKRSKNIGYPVDINFVDQQVNLAKAIKNENEDLFPDIKEYLNILRS